MISKKKDREDGGKRFGVALGDMRQAVDEWIAAFARAHQCEPMSLHDAILTLIRRGITASPETRLPRTDPPA